MTNTHKQATMTVGFFPTTTEVEVTVVVLGEEFSLVRESEDAEPIRVRSSRLHNIRHPRG